ncbi:asparagine synthase (glutamine-hydrolyzing) [Salinisphaera sp. C84B14]|uniref:hypothetical protein n=1 Tax=Salinisphaera sp. C84B14 TaxID=1304155 RepID=UPI00334045CA
MTQRNTVDLSALGQALHYGSIIRSPSVQPALPFSTETLIEAQQRKQRRNDDPPRLLKEGAELWRNVCLRVVERTEKPLIVPLSAGLDSRAVLAGLRACGADVRAVTYGIPGAFDYDLALPVARATGAPIDRFDLRKIEVKRADLLSLAKRSPRPSVLLDMFYNDHIAQYFGDGYTYANGFIGDVLAGKNLGKAGGLSWDEARAQLAAWCRLSRTATLTAPGTDPLDALPDAPFVSLDLLPAIQQLDYGVRQQMLVRPIVCPPGFDVVTPFLDPQWCAFMLGLPDDIRKNRAFFIELFQYAFPEVFALPTTASGGLPLGADERAIRHHKKRLKRRRRMRRNLSRILPWVDVPPANRSWQYLDFRQLLRDRSDFHAMYAQGMQQLDESQHIPWLEATALLDEHRAGGADHTKALHALFNISLLLEARPDLFGITDSARA